VSVPLSSIGQTLEIPIDDQSGGFIGTFCTATDACNRAIIGPDDKDTQEQALVEAVELAGAGRQHRGSVDMGSHESSELPL